MSDMTEKSSHLTITIDGVYGEWGHAKIQRGEEVLLDQRFDSMSQAADEVLFFLFNYDDPED